MAGRIILVTGGARSGKSAFAESLAAETAGKKHILLRPKSLMTK